METRKILNSWKDISAHLGRGIRTVQRWEVLFQMPVHRPAGKSRSAVVAFSDELDAWLSSPRTLACLSNQAEALASTPKPAPEAAERTEMMDLLIKRRAELKTRTAKLERLMQELARQTELSCQRQQESRELCRAAAKNRRQAADRLRSGSVTYRGEEVDSGGGGA